MALPKVVILKGREARTLRGHPWVFANEVQMDANAKAIAPGSLVNLVVEGGDKLGVATFNPHTLIAARRLFSDKADGAWLRTVIARAQALRQRFYDKPYYRLFHAEADGLPGLVVDRYGDVLSVQANTAGMDRWLPELLPALQEVTGCKAIALTRHGAAVQLEGLSDQNEWAVGNQAGPVEIIENGARYVVDITGGQKTGWFYDQRENRAFIARLAQGKSFFDGYCYAGGFGVLAAVQGASAVVLADQSAGALNLAAQAAKLNGVSGICSFEKADVLELLESCAAQGKRFDMVNVDPPAFIKRKQDIGAGMKGYRKLARLAASVVAPGGFLAIGSCSHHAEAAAWAQEVARGVHEADRRGRIVFSGGAGPDHPVHPLLPESAYLKFQVLALD
jgi:23S rRNA (cytosine1962-C5)-methyltransferase